MPPPTDNQAKAQTMGTAIAAAFTPPPLLSLSLPSFAVKGLDQRQDDQGDNVVDNGSGHNELTQRGGEDATRLQHIQGNAGTGRPERAAQGHGGREVIHAQYKVGQDGASDGRQDRSDPSSAMTMARIPTCCNTRRSIEEQDQSHLAQNDQDAERESKGLVVHPTQAVRSPHQHPHSDLADQRRQYANDSAAQQVARQPH
jgi:hypothetical protein